MNYQEAVDWIHGQYGLGKKNGLENEKELMRRMENPQKAYPCVHVAGTNGKGSVCSMLESVIRAAGMKTGLYTSPFLCRYNERMRVNGKEIADEELAEIATGVRVHAEAMREDGFGATVFELGTACAYTFFKRQNVDFSVIEVGLGGRLDPTNVIIPSVSVIARIGMDHEKILGDSLTKIAWEKAGIVKEGVPCVLYPQDGEIAKIVQDVCAEKNAPFIDARNAKLFNIESDLYGHRFSFRFQDETLDELEIKLPGDHQLDNARTALTALFILRKQGYQLPDEAIRIGMRNAKWPGRLDWRGNLLLDGAHNPQGAKALATYIEKWMPDMKINAICGILRGKDREGIIGEMAHVIRNVTCVPMQSHRETTAEEIQEIFMRHAIPTKTAPNIHDALKAASKRDSPTVVFGSLHLIGEAIQIINDMQKEG